MLDLRNILQLVNHRFNDGAFAGQQLVREPHQVVFHVAPGFGKELNTVGLQELCRGRQRPCHRGGL